MTVSQAILEFLKPRKRGEPVCAKQLLHLGNRAAVDQARRSGKNNALLVWRGDWVQSQGEEGKGLAAVRQAMVWEVAFAPAACRAQSVRGMVLITLADNGGSGRVAFGNGN